MRIYYHRMWGQLSTTCINLLKYPNWELLVAVDHNQLQTIASETVDPIDWSHPLPSSWAVPPELHVLHGLNPAYKSQEHASMGMPVQHTACAATQGIKNCFIYFPLVSMNLKCIYPGSFSRYCHIHMQTLLLHIR